MVGLTDSRCDEQRPTPDLVTEQTGDDGDDEVVDVEAAVDEQLSRRVGDCERYRVHVSVRRNDEERATHCR